MNHIIAKVKDTNNTINQLCDAVEKQLYENKIYYESVYEDNGYLVIDCDGDWKHDHLRLKLFVLDNFTNLKFEYTLDKSPEREDDCYYGSHYFSIKGV